MIGLGFGRARSFQRRSDTNGHVSQQAHRDRPSQAGFARLLGGPCATLDVTSAVGTDRLGGCLRDCRPCALRRRIGDQRLFLVTWSTYDDNRSMPLWGNSVGELGAP